MSFMDEMRQHHQDTAARQHDEHQRLVDISHQIIRDEIGHNFRESFLSEIKEAARTCFARGGKIEVLRTTHIIRLSHAVSECDGTTIEAYLKEEADAAINMFDLEVDGAWRHKMSYWRPGGHTAPALATWVETHKYTPPEDESHQPYWFRVGVAASYDPPLT